jgi:hypothetical protein
VRYYQRYIEPGGLPHLRLYGVYAPTARDGDKQFYAALLRHCEAVIGQSQPALLAAAAGAKQQSAAEQGSLLQLGANGSQAALQQQVQEMVTAAHARVGRFSAEERAALLHSTDAHAAVEQLLGMRLFLGGISHKQYHDWARQQGYDSSSMAGAEL